MILYFVFLDLAALGGIVARAPKGPLIFDPVIQGVIPMARLSAKIILKSLLYGGFLLSFTCVANAEGRLHLFQVSNGDPAQTFVIALSDTSKIDTARKIAAGQITDAVHVNGKIVKSRALYNPKWSFHFSPQSITFITFAPTICGRGMSTSDIEQNLQLVGKPGSPLAAGWWCPLGSHVQAELTNPKP